MKQIQDMETIRGGSIVSPCVDSLVETGLGLGGVGLVADSIGLTAGPVGWLGVALYLSIGLTGISGSQALINCL